MRIERKREREFANCEKLNKMHQYLENDTISIEITRT